MKSLNFFSGVIESVDETGDDGGKEGISITEPAVPESGEASRGSLKITIREIKIAKELKLNFYLFCDY